MTRAQYATRYALNLLGEVLVFGAFGALGWNAVLDADTFVALVEHQHYALALLISMGVCAYVGLATLAIPTLRDMRKLLRHERMIALIRIEDSKRVRRLRLLVQTPVNNDHEARALMQRMNGQTLPGVGHR